MGKVIPIESGGAEAAQSELEQAVAGGGVAVFPADGLYGLASDPRNEKAIARIHAIKGRDDGKPSAVMYFSPLAMRELLESLGPRTREAIGALMPGPVTLVVANPDHRYSLACRDNPTRLGIRLIEGPLAGSMCPVFQTSANRTGEPAPADFGEVPRGIVGEADLAIDGGGLTALPSTVIDITGFEENRGWSVLRQGGLSLDGVAERLD